jgi:hypothetical protein
MSFKDKPLKKIVSDNRVTIDVLHNNLLNEFNNNELEFEGLKDTLNNYKKIYATTNCEKYLIKINKIKDKIKNFNKDKKNNYYLDAGLLLSEYYDKKEHTNIISSPQNNFVIDLMLNKDNDNDNDKYENKNKDIINEYICKIDDNKVKNFYIKDLDICKICRSKLILKNIEGQLLCENCGYTENIIINSEKSSYKDPPRETSYFAYKRINHFNEWLAQFQAKETTDISDKIYNDIIKELKKEKYLDINNITYSQIRDILKKLKYNKYYEHIPHIINIINGKKAPVLTRQYEEQLRMMFKEIQVPFMNNCPDDRKNFLSYSYVLHKFCQLLELDEFLTFFPLLKSREKLQQQDKIWKKICNDLKWQYIPSI